MDNNNFRTFGEKILTSGQDVIFKVFGDTGLNLYNFISRINLNHSDLDCLLNEDHKLFCELLESYNYLKIKKLNHAQKFIIENIKKYNFCFNQTTLPNNSQRHARFSIDKERLRLSKKNYKFCSKSFNKDISKFIHEVSDDLELFQRNNMKHIEKIKSLEKKKQRYEQLMCNELSNSIGKFIEILSQKKHHGYKQIPIKVAVCLAAKINNIDIDEGYQPVIYPFFEFEKFASLETMSQIKEAENEGFPYFDHYLIVVPSFLDHEKHNDLNVLINKNMKSLVLGEKDGVCYFICLW